MSRTSSTPSGALSTMATPPVARLSVAVLLLRLVLFAWHAHPGLSFAPHGPVWTTGAPAAPAPDKGEGLLHECDLCQLLHHGGVLGAPELVAFPVPPVAAAAVDLSSFGAPARPLPFGFRSRAPPLA